MIFNIQVSINELGFQFIPVENSSFFNGMGLKFLRSHFFLISINCLVLIQNLKKLRFLEMFFSNFQFHKESVSNEIWIKGSHNGRQMDLELGEKANSGEYFADSCSRVDHTFKKVFKLIF